MYITPVSGRMIAATPKILPAVYDNAMTYIEQLHILNDKINEIIGIFNEWGGSMLNSANQYTDAQIALLQTTITNDFNNYKNEINADFQSLKQEIESELENALDSFEVQANELIDKLNSEVNKFNTQFNQLQISINALFDMLGRNNAALRQEFQESFQGMQAYINQQVASKLGSEIVVNNPYTQGLSNLDKALQDLYNIVGTQSALTVDQYRELGLTADIYKQMQITANDYKYRAIWIFFKPLFLQDISIEIMKLKTYVDTQIAQLQQQQYMQSPFTGTKDLIPNVIYHLAQLHFKTVTANQYKALDLTADVYEGKLITAYEYIWNNPLLT